MASEKRPYPRAKIKWPVVVNTPEQSIEAVTLDICPDEMFIRCPNPLKLNANFEILITTPSPERTIQATAEVVWSNRYGPDDDVTPRGMRARFVDISDEDRRFLAKAAIDHFKSEKVDPKLLETLETLTIEPD